MIQPDEIPVLPVALWYPMQQGYNLARGEGRRLNEADSGPPMVTPRRSLVADRVQLTLFLDRTQRAIFDRFYYDELAGGTWHFLMPDPETDGWPLLDENFETVLDENDVPVLIDETWIVMLARPPSHGFAEMINQVSLDLYVMP